MVVGAQKSGTTSLHHYLGFHPSVFLPATKETKFFVDPERYQNGPSYYREEYFGSVQAGQTAGEVDPDYMYFSEALDRMQSCLDVSKLKIIFLLRDPVERAFSHYLMTLRRGHEPLSFGDAVQAEAERLSTAAYFDRMHYSYVDRGRYVGQIRRFLEVFDRQNTLVLFTEELEHSPADLMHSVFEFIGVDGSGFVGETERFHQAEVPRNLWLLRRIKQADTLEKRILRGLVPSALRAKWRASLLQMNQKPNSGENAVTMEKEVRVQLRDHYRPFDQQLVELVGRALPWQ